MNPLLLQFLAEGRDFLQSIGEKLLQLEKDPRNSAGMDELFRLVHTLKGNSGLFDLPEMTRVLHAAEDLMDATRDGRVAFSGALADRLLEAMDFVAALLDEIAASDTDQPPNTSRHAGEAVRLGELLRGLMGEKDPLSVVGGQSEDAPPEREGAAMDTNAWRLDAVPETLRMDLYRRLCAGETFCWLLYHAAEDCFFKGEDPFFQVIQLPGVVWRRVLAREEWPPLSELDAYQCILTFELILHERPEALAEHFRYVAEQVDIRPLTAAPLIVPTGRVQSEPMSAEFTRAALTQLDAGNRAALAQAARTLLELSAPDLWIASALRWLLLVLDCAPQSSDVQRALILAIDQHSSPLGKPREDPRSPAARGNELNREDTPPASGTPVLTQPNISAEAGWSAQVVLEAQREILSLADSSPWLTGRLRAVAASLAGTCVSLGRETELAGLEQALDGAIAARSPLALFAWLDRQAVPPVPSNALASPPAHQAPATAASVSAPSEEPVRFNRRAEDQLTSPRTIKVDQIKIDRLMNLIGEMVVAKNALPYLAGRAEVAFGVRELSREIKSQYSVINRIAEEMQDAIMQVRLLPVSFVFQRFPRLVRDLAHKLNKDVRLVMEGESTEADKNIIEALADPLMHIVRNSLDHGLESPAERQAAGKPGEGRLTIQARQESDRVLIEIADDGRGIDPAVIRQKAYEKGIVDEATLERLTDQDAVNLVFAAGFSTAEQITDVSGRGVGMDVVRDAIAKVNGSIELRSQVGQGTQLRLSLPLSMAVSHVMIIESAGQRFGVPMDAVVETVRVPRRAIRTIKRRLATVLRERLVPLIALNELLALDASQLANGDDEFAVLVVRIDGDYLGIIVDDCRETVDIILKPLAGFLGGLGGYAGSALLGDGSVLLVLNPRELL
ncbi:chemotaxis protein CheA [Thiocystis violascens]|uniref:Chemotaxis protein CheA n=1 Tax=Thiocystis violascens (strain ATCC 17096 / DSM 198 / 6111) TaxID=765911 RepID=I3Y5X8_THIV6|nr:chemotaxis protein CheA [Thiocystis violascens]AFL72396.1 chemotaxis protein histidine kinase-like protein [Thiocystis violascens DSM 198]